MTNDFDVDLRESEIITAFLDRHFYDVLKTNQLIEDYERFTDDMEKQYDGVDIVVIRNGRPFLIDEKAQSHYGNKPLPTFAFETSYINRYGAVKTGWLVDEDKKTEFWLIIWPTIKYNGKLLRETDIVQLEVMLIRKKTLLDYFEHFGWNKDEIKKFDYYYRSNAPRNHKGEPIEYLIEQFPSDRKLENDRRRFYWYYSTQLKEKPINIVVRKSELKTMASSIYIVKSGLIRKIK